MITFDNLVALRDVRVGWDEMYCYVWVMNRHHLRQVMVLSLGREVSEEELDAAVNSECYLLGRPIRVEPCPKIECRVVRT